MHLWEKWLDNMNQMYSFYLHFYWFCFHCNDFWTQMFLQIAVGNFFKLYIRLLFSLLPTCHKLKVHLASRKCNAKTAKKLFIYVLLVNFQSRDLNIWKLLTLLTDHFGGRFFFCASCCAKNIMHFPCRTNIVHMNISVLA